LPSLTGACPTCGLLPNAAPADEVTRGGPYLGTPPGDADETGLGLEAAFVDPVITRHGSASSDTDETNLDNAAPTPVGRSATRARGSRPTASSAQDLVGHELGPRYHIIKLLGAGGMGAVYQAWDAELGVAVALKVVLPEVAADPETARMLERRFKQELLLARKVTHRNIVRVHDIGDVDGVKYITMSFVEGEDLATILKREGKLPVQRVLKMARSVVGGLQAAHAVGVIHRDLKPANIMIDADGEGLIMDFGVARSTTEIARTSSKVRLPAGAVSATSAQTMAGSIVGTIEYMAPEQARAEPVDHRADIYAFGLILYDLLLGKIRAHRTNSAFAELQLRMQEPPPAPRTQDPSIPPEVDRLIVRCLQPDPAQRFQSTADLANALGRLDDDGVPKPLVRRLTWKGVAATVVGVAMLLGATWWFAQPPPPPVEHEPVSILIADFDNATGDATLNGTLEPMLKLALEGAGFISAYDRNGIRRTLGTMPPERLDENAGREIAVKQGVGVVLAGALTRDGSGYGIGLKAVESVTGNVIVETSGRAAGKDQVLAVATTLGNDVRTALGDETSDSAKKFATETLSATSLDVVREYAAGVQAVSTGKFEEGLQRFKQAATLDPTFGLAYTGMASASGNMGQQQEAEAYVREAIKHVDKMTERERFRTRGMFYYTTNDYEACVKEYGDLVARFAGDAAARNNLALCSTKLRDLARAREEMARVVALLPKRSLYRVNVALYSVYAGSFEAGEQEARVAQELNDPWALQALALAQQGQGKTAEAIKSYEALATVQGAGPSYTASGLGDVAVYEGRFDDAVRLYAGGAKADLAAQDGDRAAYKQVALALAELARGRQRQARAAAEQALANAADMLQVRFLAGRVFAQTGAIPQAQAIAAKLSAELQAEPQAYGRIIEAIIALERKDARTAVKLLTEATALLDTWIGRFDLGRAYFAAGAYPQADSEFDRCLKRQGEAISLFLDEEPTSGFLPPVYYHQGRVREAMGTAGFGDLYQRYLAIRGHAADDPLVADIRKRLSASAR
jgi:serine/threonine protein kinase/Flp pilus assembly protein TadD